jgi:hypothetical protein
MTAEQPHQQRFKRQDLLDKPSVRVPTVPRPAQFQNPSPRPDFSKLNLSSATKGLSETFHLVMDEDENGRGPTFRYKKTGLERRSEPIPAPGY